MKDGSKISRKLATNVQRNIHIWIISIILDFFIVLYNANFIDITGWFPWSQDIVTAHGAALLVLSFIFVIPIIYASIVYGLRGTLLTWFVFMVAVLPRTILETRSLEDALGFHCLPWLRFYWDCSSPSPGAPENRRERWCGSLLPNGGIPLPAYLKYRKMNVNALLVSFTMIRYRTCW